MQNFSMLIFQPISHHVHYLINYAQIIIKFQLALKINNKIKYRAMHLHQDTEQILSKRFKIKRLLGKGSFGNVYECEEKKDNAVYAVKIISKSNVKRSKIQCLKQQATLLLSLDHPNIVKVFQFFEDEKVMFIKMQYVENGTLGQLMKQRQTGKNPFTDEQTSQIMCSIFKAVNYIHSLSILHRDIKPQNILVSDKSHFQNLKIADFGLGAKLQFRSPTATSKCGTYLYMAPQIMWNYTYTKAVDVWSCAIIMYMLKKGCHPFYQAKITNEQFKEKIRNVIFPPLQEENPQNVQLTKNKTKQQLTQTSKSKKTLMCQDFIKRISKLSPNQRYTAQDALKHPWITRNFQDEIPLSLHDSFGGFEVSHEISLMTKMFLVLKSTHFKKQSYQKLRKNQMFEKYLKHCQEVNRKDRCVSPLKVRRLSSLNNTRQIRQLCQLSEMTISPKKSKQSTKIITQSNDRDNPTIMKLNKIFNNLFDRKQKKCTRGYAEQFMNNLNQNQGKEKCYEYKQVPDISSYKDRIQAELEKAVKERHKRKKVRILPLRKKNQYGQYVGISCETNRTSKSGKRQQIDIKMDQIHLNSSITSNTSNDSSGNKPRFRRKLNSHGVSSQNPGAISKYIT